jgi:hypothetical protein
MDEKLVERLNALRAASPLLIGDAIAALTAAEARIKMLEQKLRSISYHYDNQDMSHVDFRVFAAHEARSVVAPGHTDLMISPEDLDAFLDAEALTGASDAG